MGFGSVRWFTHIVRLLVCSFVRTFVSLLCHHIISISWEIHICPTCPLFPATVTKLFILPILVGGFCYCVFDFSPWCDHDYSPVCICVSLLCVWLCLCVTCVTEWQSLRINTMTGCIVENFFDYRSIRGHLVCHFQASPLSSCRILFTYFTYFTAFLLFLFQEFRCVITTWSHFGENLPI